LTNFVTHNYTRAKLEALPADPGLPQHGKFKNENNANPYLPMLKQLLPDRRSPEPNKAEHLFPYLSRER
jgi:hypothetical protein